MSHPTPEAVPIGSFECSFCGRTPLQESGCFRCHGCRRTYCVECFEPNYEDPSGRTHFCPRGGCRTKHRFPEPGHRTRGIRTELPAVPDTPRPTRPERKSWRMVRDFLSTIPGTKP